MSTLSLDLRERILAAYDNHEGTRDEVARRFRVSVGMVKKLLQQRRRIGDIAPQHHRAGRKPLILGTHQAQMRELLAQKPDLTLKELRQRLGLGCSLPAVHYALERMGLTYKKRLSGPASKTAPTSPGLAAGGSGTKAGGIRRGSSSSMSQARRRT